MSSRTIKLYVYSETSDKGYSERGQTSQQRTSHKYSCIHTLYKNQDNLSTKDKPAGPEGVLIKRGSNILYITICFQCTLGMTICLMNPSVHVIRPTNMLSTPFLFCFYMTVHTYSRPSLIQIAWDQFRLVKVSD